MMLGITEKAKPCFIYKPDAGLVGSAEPAGGSLG